MAAEFQPQYEMDFWMDGPDSFDGELSLPPYLDRQYDDTAETEISPRHSPPSTPPSLSPPQRPLAKKIKISLMDEIRDWFRRLLADELAPVTLRESSAKEIATNWLGMNEVKAQLEAMGKSEMAFYFKAEIGVHLKGEALAYYITSEGGLLELSQRCWPETFERLLMTVYREISWLGKTQDIAGRRHLSRCIRLFRESAKETTSFALLRVHRMGLTYAFERKHRQNDDERPILEYYDAQEQRNFSRYYYYPKLVYPLPPVLQYQRPSVQMSGDYAPNKAIQEARNQRRREMEQDDFWNEEQGKILSRETMQHRQNSYHELSQWNQVDSRSLLCRHYLLLTVMIYAHFSHAPQQVIVAAFLALTHPFYAGSGMRQQDPERMRKVTLAKSDIYWYLGRALCSIHAKMDLPLACLYMATRQVKSQTMVCQSELARLALLKLEILLNYGMYTEARDLFGEWFQRMPSSSWLHEELVMMYCAGMFYQWQDTFIEIHLTELLHAKCEKLPCYTIHIEPMVRSISNQIFLLKSILHCCLSNLTIREDFRSDCKNALQLCIFYHFTILKIGYRHLMTYSKELKNIYEQLNWNYTVNVNSCHLEPFLMPIPYSVQSDMFWKELFRKTATQDYAEWQKKTQSQDIRFHAEYRFTLLVSGLFHRWDFRSTTAEMIEWTEATLKMYRGCTGQRHHRVKLLEKLHWKLIMGPKVGLEGGSLRTRRELYEGLPTNRQDLDVELATYPNLHHPKMTKKELSAQNLTRHYIQDFAQSTMRDCLNDFDYQNFSSDDMFCAYLRLRDSKVMEQCIQSGLACFRFAE